LKTGQIYYFFISSKGFNFENILKKKTSLSESQPVNTYYFGLVCHAPGVWKLAYELNHSLNIDFNLIPENLETGQEEEYCYESEDGTVFYLQEKKGTVLKSTGFNYLLIIEDENKNIVDPDAFFPKLRSIENVLAVTRLPKLP
jgi:hypothetical protein